MTGCFLRSDDGGFHPGSSTAAVNKGRIQNPLAIISTDDPRSGAACDRAKPLHAEFLSFQRRLRETMPCCCNSDNEEPAARISRYPERRRAPTKRARCACLFRRGPEEGQCRIHGGLPDPAPDARVGSKAKDEAAGQLRGPVKETAGAPDHRLRRQDLTDMRPPAWPDRVSEIGQSLRPKARIRRGCRPAGRRAAVFAVRNNDTVNLSSAGDFPYVGQHDEARAGLKRWMCSVLRPRRSGEALDLIKKAGGLWANKPSVFRGRTAPTPAPYAQKALQTWVGLQLREHS